MTSQLKNCTGGNLRSAWLFRTSSSATDATCFPLSWEKSTIVMKIPFCASANTNARPMPEAPPVTMAERPGFSSIVLVGWSVFSLLTRYLHWPHYTHITYICVCIYYINTHSHNAIRACECNFLLISFLFHPPRILRPRCWDLFCLNFCWEIDRLFFGQIWNPPQLFSILQFYLVLYGLFKNDLNYFILSS